MNQNAVQDFHQAIEACYRAVEAAVEARDARAWFDAMYSEDIVITGEGEAGAVRGREALVPGIEGIVQAVRSCSIELDSATSASAELGYSFATYTCRPVDTAAPDFRVRALFVWRLESAGWRVVAEMYQTGRM